MRCLAGPRRFYADRPRGCAAQLQHPNRSVKGLTRLLGEEVSLLINNYVDRCNMYGVAVTGRYFDYYLIGDSGSCLLCISAISYLYLFCSNTITTFDVHMWS